MIDEKLYMIESKESHSLQLWRFRDKKKYYNLTEIKRKVYLLRKKWGSFYEYRISAINQKIIEY